MNGVRYTLLVATLLLAACGAVKQRTVLTAPPAYAAARTAELDDLVELVNSRYAGIQSITVSRFDVEFTGGSIEDGYFEKYRKAKGYLVAKEPDSIFVNILNPLTNSSVLVMASREDQFQIWVPSRNQFVTGRTDAGREEDNPIYNVRPSHIVEAILIDPIPLDDSRVKFSVEEDQDEAFKYYILSVFQAETGSPVLKLLRRIWIERSTFQMRKQQYFRGSELLSVITYGLSENVDDKLVASSVEIDRPVERYSIGFELDSDSVSLNRQLKPDSFVLTQPAGAELVVVKDKSN